jgi:hypothetical protein
MKSGIEFLKAIETAARTTKNKVIGRAVATRSWPDATSGTPWRRSVWQNL